MSPADDTTLEALAADGIVPVEVGPGCFRRDLPALEGARMWIVDMEPGARWPWPDEHDGQGEHLFVVSGELIEGERRFAAGTYVRYRPNSTHQPRTETGVRLFGFNLAAR
jgi:hypothetical protein